MESEGCFQAGSGAFRDVLCPWRRELNCPEQSREGFCSSWSIQDHLHHCCGFNALVSLSPTNTSGALSKADKRLVICSGIPDAEDCSLHFPERRLIPGRAGISPAWCLPSLYLSGLRLLMALWRGLKLSFDFPIAPDLCCQLGKPGVGVAGLWGVGEQSRRDAGPFSWGLLWLCPPLAYRWLTIEVLSIFYWNRDVEFRIEKM